MPRLAELMAEHGVKDATLADKLSVTTLTVWRWRAGRSSIPDKQKLALAEHFGVSVTHLMGWDEYEVVA